MAQEKSKKSGYSSKYGGGYISPAQFLAEMMCERLATKNKQKLPNRFWEDAFWAKTFKKQIMDANKLLKDHDIHHILKALDSFKCKFVYSLGLKNVLLPAIEYYERLSETEAKAEEVRRQSGTNLELRKDFDTSEKPRSAFSPQRNNKKNLLSELD